MITEDYVSFRVAKLLKEKGFDEKCVSVYHDGELQLVSSLGIFSSEGYGEQILTYTNSECEWSPIMVSAPTLQMAMKWLREVHGIDISIAIRFWTEDEDVYVKSWKYTVYHTEEIEDFGQSDTYEEAAEAAIKYCVENLI